MVVDIKSKLIGIYKITSPSGKIYIGQGIDLELRFKRYKRLACKKQIKLYNSFLKYGYINHKIEIIEFCNEEELNIRERYYQDLYDVLKGLNCRLTTIKDHSGKMSEESKQKMSKSHKGKILSEEHKLNIKNNSGKAKKVICLLTNRIWNSCTDCALDNNINENTLRVKLSGNYKNNTTYRYEEKIL